MNTLKKKVVLFVVWAMVVPVFVLSQVSFWQGMTQKANAGTEADKRDAITALANYKNPADYRDAEKVTLANAITAGNTAITNAADNGVKDALSNAKGVIDAIKTDAELTVEEDKQAALDKANDEKDSLESKLKKETAALLKLQQQKAQIGQSVSITQISINKTQSVIKDTAQTISRKEAEVKNLQEKIELQKTMLIGLLQQVYYNQSQPILSVVLTSKNFSDVFSDIDHLLTVGDKLKSVSAEISQTKTQIEQDNAELAIEKQKHEEILADKIDQKQELVANQVDVQGNIAEKEATIGELQQKLAELQKDLNKVTGKSYSATDVKDAIEFASRNTGVRKGYLFGMLSMESGGNPLAGNCTLDNAGMNKTRKDYFGKICSELGFSDKECKKMPVSCASKSYPGSGGAMGAAQFMSDTWWGYKSKIASTTGHNPPNPWDLTDGVAAMALYLKNLGATNSGTVSIKNPCNGKSVKVKWEIYASMRYLGWTCYGYTNYAPGVQSLAKGYDKL